VAIGRLMVPRYARVGQWAGVRDGHSSSHVPVQSQADGARPSRARHRFLACMRRFFRSCLSRPGFHGDRVRSKCQITVSVEPRAAQASWRRSVARCRVPIPSGLAPATTVPFGPRCGSLCASSRVAISIDSAGSCTRSTPCRAGSAHASALRVRTDTSSARLSRGRAGHPGGTCLSVAG
jgi:hypothetical protein